MKTKVLVLMVALVSIAAGMAIYQKQTPMVSRLTVVESDVQQSTVVASSLVLASESFPPQGFSFNPLDEPRTLPEARFTDGEGRAMTLADFRGRVVLLNVWATWCVPCRAEMPTLDRLQARMGSSEFQVVALSIDTQVEVVEAFFGELGLMALGIYSDKSVRTPMDLNIVGIPATLLIDRQGKEIGRVIGPAEWDSDEVMAAIRYYLDAPMVVQANSG